VSEIKYPRRQCYHYFANRFIVPVHLSSAKPRGIVKALKRYIVHLSDEFLHDVDGFGQYHPPKKIQSVTVGGTKIVYGFPSSMLD